MMSGVGHLLERGVDGDAEEAVLAAHLAAFVTDERHVDRGNALQHLVRADPVERGELREEGYDDLHGVTFLGRGTEVAHG